jgi:hypothetical protein
VNRRARGSLLLLGAGLAITAAWIGLQPRTPEQRLQAAWELAASVRVAANVTGSSLLATNAIADFGVGKEVRLVRVRIVEALQLQVRIESEVDVSLGGPPRLCLVGAYAAPDDAGLTDRCWGDPDLTATLAAHVGADASGRVTLHAGTPIEIAVDLRRGEIRCDYPPGTWGIEVWLAPVIDGVATEDLLATTGDLVVPFLGSGPLSMRRDARYCGLANAVYRDQGEPDLATP